MDNLTLMRRANPQFVGMEIFDIKPILLGGDSVDPKNKTVLTRHQHIDAVRYWNRVIKVGGLNCEEKNP